MVILITGATHVGKTLLAQRMLEQYHFPCLSIDHLKMGLIRSGYTTLTPEDDEELTGYLWPVVREMIKTAIENRQNLIVEGCYIPFDWRNDFDPDYLPAIRFVCLAMSDAYIDGHFREIREHASEIESRLYDEDLSAEQLKAENRAYIEGCRANAEPVTIIDGDYEGTIWRIVASLNICSAEPECSAGDAGTHCRCGADGLVHDGSEGNGCRIPAVPLGGI